MPYNTGNPDVDAMINRDAASWERQLREGAASRGVSYDDSDLQDVIRNVSYKQNGGRDPKDFINAGLAKYGERAAPTGHRDFDSQGPMYDQRTNQLSPAGVQATAQLQQRRAAARNPMGGSLSSLLNYQPTRGMSAPMLKENAAPGAKDMYGYPTSVQPLPHIFGDDNGGLPPGVPPGSVPVNAGFNPDLWAYQTPDGRIIRGSRGGGAMTVPGRPVSTAQPVGGSTQLSSLLRSY